ncbi:MAG TPA: ribonuclease J [Acidobacteriota bacterium]|nr:ribonuclease J [Acidobacteriota bacterium]
MTADDRIEAVPLGGLGEFGMNMMAIRHGGSIVVIDAGLMFPRDELLGVDLVVPNLAYLLEKKEEVAAVVLTHGHEDHIGALPYLLEAIQVPVYGTPLTLGFAEGRLAEHGILEQVELNRIHPRDTLQIGDMHLEFLGVTHSIADSIGIAITTPVGTLIHTGDFKFDQSPPDRKFSDYARFAHFGEQGVLALFSDSTNSERPGYTPSESHVRRHLEQVFHTSRRKIIMACFASSVHRIQITLELAEEFGRSVVAVGRSMKENIAIARDLGYLRVPPGVLVDLPEASRLADDKIVVLCTGSQGEPMAALARLALGKHKEFSVEQDDSVIISARAIPGNESHISHLINHFCRRGANVFDESRWMVHVSGHASQEELKLMLNLTRPQYLIPVHGEFRQLYSHMLIARDTGMPRERIILAETGDIISLSPESAVVCGKAPFGRRLIDEGGVAELDEFVVRDRQHLSEEGVVLAVVAINKSTGHVEGQPELVSRGHVQENEGAAFLSEAREIVLHSLEESTVEEREDPLVLTELIRADLKRFFRKRTGTRPMIVPVVMEI